VLDTYYYAANSNRLSNIARNATATRIFSYDAAGNVIQDLRGANAYNYAVNNAGRIRQMSLNTGASVVANYTYDGFQKLRMKTSTSPAATTHYVWDQFGHIIAETSGAFTREYIWLGDTPLAINEGATLSYVHPDHLDRPVAMTTSGGQAVAWSARYDPFGNVVTITNPAALPLRFPGQVFQIEDGLSYNWHRNYDPTLGRYSQADPLGFVDGPGKYNYAGQSPLMVMDRDGRCPWCIGAIIGGGISLGLQLYDHGGRLECVNWWDVGLSAALGGAFGFGGRFAAGVRKPGYHFSHWYPDRWGGPRAMWNGNYVPALKHALSDPYSYNFLPKAIKEIHPKWDVVRSQLYRIPRLLIGYAGSAGSGYTVNELN
jgi:RHS repeat-associated protein